MSQLVRTRERDSNANQRTSDDARHTEGEPASRQGEKRRGDARRRRRLPRTLSSPITMTTRTTTTTTTATTTTKLAHVQLRSSNSIQRTRKMLRGKSDRKYRRGFLIFLHYARLSPRQIAFCRCVKHGLARVKCRKHSLNR